jgi:hypothetical protein
MKRVGVTRYNKTYEGYNTIKLMEVAVPDRVIRTQLARSTRLPGCTLNVKIFITVYIILVLFVYSCLCCVSVPTRVIHSECGRGRMLDQSTFVKRPGWTYSQQHH